jgi:glycosyltransferase involved in cell wall biosynthesis
VGLLALLLVEHGRPCPSREEMSSRPTGPGGPTVVVVPTYDEAENLPGLARRLLALGEGLRVLVVDDASPDGTGEIADRLARETPGRVEVLHRPRKLGLGTAYLDGIGKALSSGAARVVTMDADLSHEPERLPALLAASERADVVIGSRYVSGGDAVDSPLFRRLHSRTANLAAHATLGLATRDATAGFRVYGRSAAEALLAAGVVSSGYSFLLEATFLFEERRFVVAEVPIRFRDRREGRSKISRGEIAKAVATVARLSARRLGRLLGVSAADAP